MAIAEVDIANLALISLKSDRINSIDESTIKAQKVALQYRTCRDELLSRYPWTFALARASLPAVDTAPAFEWTYAYNLPADCLSPWKVNDWQFPSTLYAVEGGQILTDIAAPVLLRYIRSTTTTAQFHPLFTRALVKLLAHELCYDLTGSAQLREQIRAEFKDVLDDAFMLNAIASGTPEEIVADDWLIARY